MKVNFDTIAVYRWSKCKSIYMISNYTVSHVSGKQRGNIQNYSRYITRAVTTTTIEYVPFVPLRVISIRVDTSSPLEGQRANVVTSLTPISSHTAANLQ